MGDVRSGYFYDRMSSFGDDEGDPNWRLSDSRVRKNSVNSAQSKDVLAIIYA